ncbi:MAG: hypothetical protein ACRC1Z_20605 [Waterburya sp.]
MTHFLSVQLRTFEAAESENLEQFPTITIFCDEQNNYFLATPLTEIETAIVNLIGLLDDNPRSALIFSVEIIPGSQEKAFLTFLRNQRLSFSPRRRSD